MKKIALSAATLAVIMPVAAHAESDLGLRPYVEYGIDLYSHTNIKMSGYGMHESNKTSVFNDGGQLTVGIESAKLYNAQLGLTGSYSKDEDIKTSFIGLNLTVPFMTGKFQPYALIGGGLYTIKADNTDIDEDTFTMQFGAGARYNISNNVSVKGGLTYTYAKMENIADTEITMKMSDLSIMTSIGYVF